MTTTEVTDIAVRPANGVQRGDIFTSDGFETTMRIAEALVKSGILPRGVDTPFKAFAIIQKGREIGVGPMRALTGIHLIEGKPTVSPELKLEKFRERGGRVRWLDSNDKSATLWLKAPNGDEHTESVTWDEMVKAGVTGKDNWRKYPKSMLRARAVGFGLRALGEGDGSYTPDELGAVTDEQGNVEAEQVDPAYRATVRDGEGDRRPKAPATSPSARETTAASTAGGASTTPATETKPITANKIPHDGLLATPAQVTLIHVLRGKVGGKYAGDDADVRTAWRKALGAYKDQQGNPIDTSTKLSAAQASHLIDRMQAAIAKQEATHAKMEAEAQDNMAAIGGGDPTAQAKLERALSELFATDADENAWLNSIGFEYRGAIPPESLGIVTEMLLAKNMGPSVYAKAFLKARSLGHIPQHLEP